MKPRTEKNPLSLSQIAREVRRTVSVYLTDEGVEHLRTTRYVRKGGYIACKRIIDDQNPYYLNVETRYYSGDSNIPKHAFLSIPNRFVKYVAADHKFHRQRRIEMDSK
jgi:hypothetical protein